MRACTLKKKLVAAYELLYEKHRMLLLRTRFRLHVMTPDATIEYIEKHHCSIARYGDGEFDHILDLKDQGFQVRSAGLTRQLADVLSKKDEKLLICVPRCMNTVEGCNAHAASFWIDWGRRDNHHQKIVSMIRSYAGRHYCFGDSQITRPYIDWVTSERAERIFPKLRHLWEEREVIIVEGDQTRMGVGNDLFDNAKSVKRILAPAEGAFEFKDLIKQAILTYFHGELILMALGPTATVLAAEFAEMGIQALDIGNIDIEYEWFLRGAKERIAIPGKYTNEARDGVGRVRSECKDERYLSQIVAKVGC